jgi:uncharacterized protein
MIKSVLKGVVVLAAAYILGSQIASFKNAERTVQVKGAAEIAVQADLATWTLGVSASSNDLATTEADFSKQIASIKAFLVGTGLKDEELENQNLSVADAAANQYNSNPGAPRFTLSGGVVVRTSNLEAINKAKTDLPKLVASGVVLTSSWGPNYSFSKLNEMKPELIAKATQAARESAEQFAKDSGTDVGGIRKARQGSVEILGRDSYMGEAEQPSKILRVVTTVDYDLK